MNIAPSARIGKDVTIREGVIIEDNVVIGDHCYLDYNAVIKANVTLGENSFVGAQCILGEFLFDFFDGRENCCHPLVIGPNALLRSGTIIYGDTVIGEDFATGHRVTIREKAVIGDHVSIGTLSDIQGDCRIGNYVHMHSNVHIGQKSEVRDYAWIFPYVVLTNDPKPPSEEMRGVLVDEFACVCTGSVVLPGVRIGRDALVGAGANVTKDVPDEMVAVGNPAKVLRSVRELKEADGTPHYPWRYRFDRGTPWRGIGYDEWMQQQETFANHK